VTGPARRSALDPGPETAREAIRIVGEAIARWYAGLGRLHPAGTAHDPATGGIRPDS